MFYNIFHCQTSLTCLDRSLWGLSRRCRTVTSSPSTQRWSLCSKASNTRRSIAGLRKKAGLSISCLVFRMEKQKSEESSDSMQSTIRRVETQWEQYRLSRQRERRTRERWKCFYLGNYEVKIYQAIKYPSHNHAFIHVSTKITISYFMTHTTNITLCKFM